MNALFKISLLRGLFILFTACAMQGCGPGGTVTPAALTNRLTQENLDKIQRDMSLAEVKSILGEPTDTKSEPIPIVGGTKTTLVYSHDQDRVVIILKNGNVQSKEGHFTAAP